MGEHQINPVSGANDSDMNVMDIKCVLRGMLLSLKMRQIKVPRGNTNTSVVFICMLYYKHKKSHIYYSHWNYCKNSKQVLLWLEVRYPHLSLNVLH